MSTRHTRTARATVLVVGVLLFAVSCSVDRDGDGALDPDPRADSATTPEPLPIVAETTGVGADEAIAFVRGLSEISVVYTTKGVTSGDWNRADLDAASASFDSASVSVDLSAVYECLRRQGDRDDVVDIYELTHMGFKAYEIDPGLWVVAYRVVEVVPGVSDMTTYRATYVTTGGIIGERPGGPSEDRSCWNAGMVRTEVGSVMFDVAGEADNGRLDAADDDVDLDLAISGTSSDDSGTANDGRFTRRDAVPADPSDPEPIRSTGADKLDILRADDPSAFVCLTYLGRGTEEILSPDKSSYEIVADAFLFVASFTDGTTIDIRVHPEVGTLDVVTAEVAKYTKPLGQLPTVLRRDIGRFAIRLGDETATASPLEGISMQTGNAAVRLGDNRLEETIFHESVHTSLDPLYVYGTSEEWFDVQDLDGRFLTEYGRNNPDGEDLAETALYAYVLLHHPDRIPSVQAAIYRERVPNRIAFIGSILPPDQPIFETIGPAPTCETP